jgi:hypothetical protein
MMDGCRYVSGRKREEVWNDMVVSKIHREWREHDYHIFGNRHLNIYEYLV